VFSIRIKTEPVLDSPPPSLLVFIRGKFSDGLTSTRDRQEDVFLLLQLFDVLLNALLSNIRQRGTFLRGFAE
jgi:hypothetical protein